MRTSGGRPPFENREGWGSLNVSDSKGQPAKPTPAGGGLARLFPIKHKDVLGLVLTHEAHGHRQGLEICRKLDLPGARNLAFEFVCDFQTALVHAAGPKMQS